MAKWLFTHHKEIITFCLFLVLVSLVGHFLADVSGFSLDSAIVADLHGNFLLNFATELVPLCTAVMIWLLPLALRWYRTAPPTPPPPITSLA
jgi:hypothetical protein